MYCKNKTYTKTDVQSRKITGREKRKVCSFFQMKLETDRMLKSQQNSLLCQVK
jgi:hypothetical protein